MPDRLRAIAALLVGKVDPFALVLRRPKLAPRVDEWSAREFRRAHPPGRSSLKRPSPRRGSPATRAPRAVAQEDAASISCMFSVTTSIVRPSSTVGLNSTTSVPAYRIGVWPVPT